VCSDVTQRKRLEAEVHQQLSRLADAEARIRSVLDNVVDGIVTIDENGTIDSFNHAAEGIFGYSSSDVVGKNVRTLMPEPYHDQHDGYLANYLSTGVAKIIGQGREVTGRRKDGSTFPLDLAVGEFRLDGHRLFTGIVRDITERKQTEQSLQFLADVSRSLATLVDFKDTLQRVAQLAVPGYADWCAVHLIDAAGSLDEVAIAHANPAKIPLTEELTRRYPLDMDAVLEVIRSGESQLVTYIDDVMIEQVAVDEEHLAMLRELALRSYMRVPLRTKEKVLGAITFASGQSGRTYRPEDLRTMQDLANRASIAIENAQLYQEVRDAARAKDEFLATLAHELRNPLTPIRSGLYILDMKTDGASETIEMMQEQVNHIVRLVEDLVDVSRIMRGKIELRRELVELSTIVDRSVRAVQSQLDERNHRLTVSMPEQSVWLHADPVRLVQVVENLLSNASKYMEPGGRIDLTVELHDKSAILTLRDHGMGIDKQLLPNIFELFTQSPRSLDRSQGGLGIGLTLVKRLVELHGGTVSATSAGPDKGSTFVVRLPATMPPQDTDPQTTTSKSPDRRRIVLVDDNASALSLVSELLRSLGDHEVVTAKDGPSALAAVKVHHPDIVLLDIGLPGMDGYEVGRTLRDNAEFDDVLLFALTGYAQAEDQQRSRDAGFDGHLVKPPSIEDLYAVLTHAKLRPI
jgi:PAS domain S-box-containing protein